MTKEWDESGSRESLQLSSAVQSSRWPPPARSLRFRFRSPATTLNKVKKYSVNADGEQVDKVGAQVFTPDTSTTYTAVATRGKKEARDSKDVAEGGSVK